MKFFRSLFISPVIFVGTLILLKEPINKGLVSLINIERNKRKRGNNPSCLIFG